MNEENILTDEKRMRLIQKYCGDDEDVQKGLEDKLKSLGKLMNISIPLYKKELIAYWDEDEDKLKDIDKALKGSETIANYNRELLEERVITPIRKIIVTHEKDSGMLKAFNGLVETFNSEIEAIERTRGIKTQKRIETHKTNHGIIEI